MFSHETRIAFKLALQRERVGEMLKGTKCKVTLTRHEEGSRQGAPTGSPSVSQCWRQRGKRNANGL